MKTLNAQWVEPLYSVTSNSFFINTVGFRKGLVAFPGVITFSVQSAMEKSQLESPWTHYSCDAVITFSHYMLRNHLLFYLFSIFKFTYLT